jgi:hypothetical protein
LTHWMPMAVGTMSVNDLPGILARKMKVSDASIDRMIDEGDLDANRQVDSRRGPQNAGGTLNRTQCARRHFDSVARRRRPVKDQPSRIEVLEVIHLQELG